MTSEAKTWKCVSIRPPVSEMNRADMSNWATEIDVPVDGCPGPETYETNRYGDYCASHEDGRPSILVKRACLIATGPGPEPKCQENTRDPLKEHQPGKETIRVASNLLPILPEQLRRAGDGIIGVISARIYLKHNLAIWVQTASIRSTPLGVAKMRFS